MKCPVCGAPSIVKSTRGGTRRRRECFNEHRFTTVETVIARAKPQQPRKPDVQPVD